MSIYRKNTMSGDARQYNEEDAELDIVQKIAQPERRLKGIPSSPGIAVADGNAVVIKKVKISSKQLGEIDCEKERTKFLRSSERCVKELDDAIAIGSNANNATVVEILETYTMILQDPTLSASILERISTGLSADDAIHNEFDARVDLFSHARDAMLRERASELDHVRHRLIANLSKRNFLQSVVPGAIVVAHSINPTDLLTLHSLGVAGIVTEVGGIASHFSILCRALRIPAVIGIHNAVKKIPHGSSLIADGYGGIIIINPSKKTKQEYSNILVKEAEQQIALGKIKDLPCETIDKRPIQLMANVETLQEVDAAMMSAAAGIGLVRTEYLIKPDGSFPDEEEQYLWYKEIAERTFPHSVTIRAFDAGSDKTDVKRKESNPALGFRGIRYLLARKREFRAQIRAVLRASEHRNIRFMLPMICTVKEVKKSLKIIEKCKIQLQQEGLSFDPLTPIGIMIETPASALIADLLANYVDFFSIGTNDLTQYVLGADRDNDAVSELFGEAHPALFRLLEIAVQAAFTKGIPVSLCGEMAGESQFSELLIGLGIFEFSVSPPMLLSVKQAIRNVHFEKAKKDVAKILEKGKIPALKKQYPEKK